MVHSEKKHNTLSPVMILKRVGALRMHAVSESKLEMGVLIVITRGYELQIGGQESSMLCVHKAVSFLISSIEDTMELQS
jgi:hypothetical protein